MNRPHVVVPLVLLVISLSSFGQALMKRAVNAQPSGLGPVPLLRGVLGHPALYLGLALSAMGMAAWLFTLSRADLSYASPFLALGILVLIAFGALFLGEPVGARRLLGAVLVVAGMVLVGKS